MNRLSTILLCNSNNGLLTRSIYTRSSILFKSFKLKGEDDTEQIFGKRRSNLKSSLEHKDDRYRKGNNKYERDNNKYRRDNYNDRYSSDGGRGRGRDEERNNRYNDGGPRHRDDNRNDRRASNYKRDETETFGRRKERLENDLNITRNNNNDQPRYNEQQRDRNIRYNNNNNYNERRNDNNSYNNNNRYSRDNNDISEGLVRERRDDNRSDRRTTTYKRDESETFGRRKERLENDLNITRNNNNEQKDHYKRSNKRVQEDEQDDEIQEEEEEIEKESMVQQPIQRGEKEEELNIIGIKTVLVAFSKRPQDFKRLYINHDTYDKNKGDLKDIIKHFADNQLPYRFFEPKDGQMEKVSKSTHHEGICAVTRPKTPMTAEDAFEKEMSKTRKQAPSTTHSNLSVESNRSRKGLSNTTRPIVVLLDNVENPHNIGAIVRSCAVFGVETVYAYNEAGKASGGRVNPFSTASYQASRGALEHIDVVPMDYRNEVINMIKEFKERRWEIVSTSTAISDQSVTLFSDQSARMLGTRPLLLIFGSETEGVSRGVTKLSTSTLSIPTTGLMDSLNVSQALSVVLAECWRIQGRLLTGKTVTPKSPPKHTSEITPDMLGIQDNQVYNDESLSLNNEDEYYDQDDIIDDDEEEQFNKKK